MIYTVYIYAALLWIYFSLSLPQGSLSLIPSSSTLFSFSPDGLLGILYCIRLGTAEVWQPFLKKFFSLHYFWRGRVHVLRTLAPFLPPLSRMILNINIKETSQTEKKNKKTNKEMMWCPSLLPKILLPPVFKTGLWPPLPFYPLRSPKISPFLFIYLFIKNRHGCFLFFVF